MADTETNETPHKLDPYSLTSAEAKEAFSLFRKGCRSAGITMRGGENLDKVSEFLTRQVEKLELIGKAEASVFQHETGMAFNAFAGVGVLKYIGEILKKIPEIPVLEERVYIQAVLAAFFPTAINYLEGSGIRREEWWSWRDKVIEIAPPELLQECERSRLGGFKPNDFNDVRIEHMTRDYFEELEIKSKPDYAFEQWKRLIFLATYVNDREHG